MTKEDLAARLNGREYGQEITIEEESEAHKDGLVVIFGASDDLTEFRGAIYDEMDSYEGTTAYLAPDGLLHNQCTEGDNCPYFARIKASCKNKVDVIWNRDGYSWVMKTDLPHASFDIMEDGEKYCRGIVVELPRT